MEHIANINGINLVLINFCNGCIAWNNRFFIERNKLRSTNLLSSQIFQLMNMEMFRKFLIVLLLGVVSVAAAEAQTESLWKTLAKITYKKEYDDFLGFKIDKPVFSEEIKALNGKEVTVKGFIIPVEGYKGHKEFIFSAFPYSMCFFCGGAGPESVMEVMAIEPVEYTAEAVVLKGKLVLNPDDVNKLMYALTDARLVK